MVLVVPSRKKTPYYKQIEADQCYVYPVKWRPFYKFFSLEKAALLYRVSVGKMLGILRRNKTLYGFRTPDGKYFIHPDNFLKFARSRLVRTCKKLAA